MNEMIIRPGVVKKIVDLAKSRNQSYTQEVVNDVLTAFLMLWKMLLPMVTVLI